MNRNLPCYLVVVFALLLSSCATLTPKITGEPVDQEFAESLLQDWAETVVKNQSVQGMTKFEMKSPERTVKGNQVLLIEKPNRLRAELLSMFGSPLLLLAADGEQLDVHLPFENHFYSGKATAENLGRFVRLPLQLEDLINILLYQPPIMSADKESAFVLKGGGWVLERHNPPHRQKLYFDVQKRLVESSYFEDDTLFLSVNYGDFLEDSGYPQSFHVNLPREETMVKIAFSDIEVNTEMKAGIFTLAVPDGAEVFSLDDGI